MAKWVDQYFNHDTKWMGVCWTGTIKLNKDKTKCRNIHIGLDLAVFLRLQKYANVLHDKLRLMEFLEPMVSVKLNYCVCMFLDM